MLKYLIVMLDDTSVSYCYYDSLSRKPRLMPLDVLKAGLTWAMKENLMVQVVYPDREISEEYLAAINEVDHVDIVAGDRVGDVRVFNGIETLARHGRADGLCVLRLTYGELCDHAGEIADILERCGDMNIVITDIECMDDDDFDAYRQALDALSRRLADMLDAGKAVRLNLLTDRLQLERMKNCNAGVESITLAPDGRFYVCPAFYLDGSTAVGEPSRWVEIKNCRLLTLEGSPICRNCDAYHCRRCAWLNGRMTLEVNTPGHRQCVVSHIERNASRQLLSLVNDGGRVRIDRVIPKIDYLDPFEKIIQ